MLPVTVSSSCPPSMFPFFFFLLFFPHFTCHTFYVYAIYARPSQPRLSTADPACLCYIASARTTQKTSVTLLRVLSFP
jgi:hypothetical protein